MSKTKASIQACLFLVGLTLLLSACNGEESTPIPIAASPTQPFPTETPTPVAPSPTPIPLAVKVNGEGVSLEEFQREMARYKSSLPENVEMSEEGIAGRVLDDLIGQVLLAQAARQAGFVLDESTLQAHIDRLSEQIGGENELSAWIELHDYTPENFQLALRRSIEAAWMRDQIVGAVPEVAEQVHARQILLNSAENADAVLAQIKTGRDFATLAAEYDPITQGDLGWFSRGYLLDAELEEVAFNLQPENVSEVIETQLGFHILQVIERDEQRALDSEARLILQSLALAEWMAERRAESEIEITIP